MNLVFGFDAVKRREQGRQMERRLEKRSGIACRLRGFLAAGVVKREALRLSTSN